MEVVAMEDVPLAMEDAQVAMEDVEVPSSPLRTAKKMRRLRKAKETEIEVNEEPVGEVDAETVSGTVEVRRESAEEILKRFGKRGEDGRKRKAVQRTIVAAVVDMSMQTTACVGTEGKQPVRDIVDAVEDSGRDLSSHGGEQLAVEDGGRDLLSHGGEQLAADDGGLELRSHGEEFGVGSEELAPSSKKKRSNAVKRCSAHATGLIFESEGDARDDMENETGIDGGMKDRNNQQDSNAENGNEGVDDRGASDSEKGNDDSGEGGVDAGWSDAWAEEEVSMESILEKARRMVAEMSKPVAAASAKPTMELKKTNEEELTGTDDQNVKKKKSKKGEEKTKREDIYAVSQRLLRESKGVAFVAPAPVMRPVSTVLEKIRQRRLQLGCSGSGTGSSQESETKSVSRRGPKGRGNTLVDLTVNGDTEIEIEAYYSTVVKTEEVKTEETAVYVEVQSKPAQEVSRGMEEVEISAETEEKAEADSACTKTIPESSKGLTPDDLAPSRSIEKDLFSEPRQPAIDTQDLFCASQLSTATEECLPFESVGTTATDVMGVDTQLLEDFIPRSMRDNHHQEKKETDLRPSGQFEVYTTATHVRGLIDDEAEDEDEDILAENAEEEEVLGDEEDDLRDLIATTEKEKAGDKARRDALHRKWLDQQDNEQTEDILERLRTGRSTRWKGRDRIVSCLDEDDDLVNTRDSESLDKNSLSSQAGAGDADAEVDLIDDPSITVQRKIKSQDLEMECLLDEDEDAEDVGREEPVVEEDENHEDYEEHEQSFIRQRMLDESEEQLVFMSPADDESSREIFSLITKVNVNNLKTKSTPGHSENRAATSVSLPLKPSFLGRSASSSSLPPPTHRHVGSTGSSRSFVFGRDDSNSGHGFPSSQSQEEKKPGISKSASDKGFKSTSFNGENKQRPIPQPPRGPSLFEMLKKQSIELDQDLKKSTTSVIAKKWGSNAEAFSVFATKKSSASSRKKL